MKITQSRADGTTLAPTAPQQLANARYFTRLFFPIFVCMGLYHAYSGRAALERYRLLDTRGQAAVGRITDKSATGGRYTRYLLNYVFTDAGGAQRDGVSAVPYAVYNATQTGEPVNVTYLADRKDAATIGQSTGKADAQTDILGGCLLIGIGCVVTLFMAFVQFRLRKKVSQYGG